MVRIFDNLFDAVPDALVVVDGTGRIVMANRQAEQLFGYPPLALGGMEIEELLPEDARHRHRAHRTGYMSKPHIRPMGATGQTLVGLRKDGTQFPVEIALSPVGSDEGQRFLASVRDISETQRARQALVRAGYDSLVARIGQLALESNDESNMLEQVPPLLAQALGIEIVVVAFLRQDRESLDVRASTVIDPADPAAQINVLALAEALTTPDLVIENDLSQPGRSAFEFPLGAGASGSGVLVPLIDRSRALGALIARSKEPNRFDHDALHLLQSVANLIAALVQRRHTEEQLAHAQRLDALGQLTGGIAHDFNNLLTVMSGSLQLLEMEHDETPDVQELIATALRSVSRGAELTAKLLAFARRQRLLPQATDPRALLQDVESMLRRTLGDAIKLEVNCKDDLPAAFVDPTQLDAALVNLALNARDAMPHGGQIDIQAQQVLIDSDRATIELPVGYYVLIAVSDTGRGMAPATLARAMEPFFTTKEAGRGSGLGLSMVYGFAKQSGGNLQIASRLGHGTRVELYLPAARHAVPQAQPAPMQSVGGRGETVLVVEDDAAVRNIAVAFLRSSGYRVEAVASAAEALDVLGRDSDISVLFSDVMLGNGMNGNELARMARGQRPDLPVLLTSGYEEHLQTDTDAFELLRKPYRREQLLSAIRKVLDAPAARAGESQ